MRRSLRLTAWLLLWLSTAVLLIPGVALLVFWNHDGARQAVASALGARLAVTVDVDRLDLRVANGALVVVASDVELVDVDAGALTVGRLSAGIDLRRSLSQRELHVREVVVDALQFVVDRDAMGRFSVSGLPEGDRASIGWSPPALHLADSLILRDVSVLIRDHAAGIEYPLLIEQVSLRVVEDALQMIADARLPDAWGGRARATLRREGDAPLLPGLLAGEGVFSWTIELDRLEPTMLPDVLELAGVRMPPAGGRHRVGDPELAPVPTAAIDRLNATGTLRADPPRIDFEVSAGSMELELQRWLRGVIPVAVASAEGFWQRGGRGWLLVMEQLTAANEDAHGHGSLRLESVDGDRPYLDLAVTAAGLDGNVGRFGRYLPDAYIPPAVVAWLDQSIVAGTVREAQVRVSGYTRDFDVRADDALHVSAVVAEAELNPGSGWPAFDRIDGLVEVDGARLAITDTTAETAGARLSGVDVTIPDLGQAELSASGGFSGTGDTLLGYVSHMPIMPLPMRNLLEEFELDGQHRGELQLRIPFRGNPPQVVGHVDLDAATLAWPRRGLVLERIDGRLAFSDTGVQAESLQVRLGDAEGEVRVTNTGVGPGSRTMIDADVESLSVASVRDLLPGFAFLDGSTAVQIGLELPGFGHGPIEHHPPVLRLDSTLVGVAINLPEPLFKPAIVPMPARIELPLGAVVGPLHVSLADTLDGIVVWGEDGAVRAVDIGLGRLARTPGRSGVAIHGVVERIDLASWLAAGDGATGGMPGLRELMLTADHLQLGSLDLGAVALNAQGRDGELDVRLSGPRVEGLVSWAAAGGDAPGSGGPGEVSLSLSRLNLKTDAQLANTETSSLPVFSARSPASLPAVSARIAHVELDDLELGRLWLESAHDVDGVYRSELRMDRPHARLQAWGEWTDDKAGGSNALRFALRSADLGLALARAGYPNQMRGGSLELVGTLGWPGLPQDVQLASVDGHVELELGAARLPSVEPGLARMMGLVSLSSLPRRLTLDFGDVVGRGTEFEGLSAKLRIAQGIATIEQARMEGPAANVDAGGVFDLEAQSLDGWMTVTPKTSAAMPLLGGILAGPPGVATLFMVEQLVSDHVDRVARSHYQVTGSWAEPDWRRMSRLAAILPPFDMDAGRGDGD